jgi:hypothetical protein
VQFIYPELPSAQRCWWLIVDPETGVDLCSIDPGFDVDLYVSVDLRTMTAIWMGLDTVRVAVANRRMTLTGSQQLAAAMQTWLGLSPFFEETEARELAMYGVVDWKLATSTSSTVRELDHHRGSLITDPT